MAVQQLSSRSPSASSLQALFELLRDDHKVDSSKEERKILTGALGMILSKAIGALSPIATDYRYDYSRRNYSEWSLAEGERSRSKYSRLFSVVSDYCYTIGEVELVRNALQKVMQDSTWASSTDLVGIVAGYVGRGAVGRGAASWDSW
jgi:hypothetical protein